MNNARQVTQTGEYDINQQVATAAPLEEHSNGRCEDGEEDFADIAVQEGARQQINPIFPFLRYTPRIP